MGDVGRGGGDAYRVLVGGRYGKRVSRRCRRRYADNTNMDLKK